MITSYQQKQRTKAQEKARYYSNKAMLEARFIEMQKARKGAKIVGINSKTRTGAKPKTTGITQTAGEVIKTNYRVVTPQMIAPVQTGNDNDGGIEDKIGNVGFRSVLKNPVYLVLVVVVLGSLFFAFKK